MNKLLEIINTINKENEPWNILLVFLFSILFFILNFKKIYESIEEIKRNRINKLVNAINCEYVDERLKKFLEHEIQKEYFRYVSSLSIERVYREKLLDIHEEANGEIPFYFLREPIDIWSLKMVILI